MAPSKRFQVLLRPPIAAVLENFAERNGYSDSKAIARLVEEAMITRGLIDRKQQLQIGDNTLPGPSGTTVEVTHNRKPSEDDAWDGPDLRSHELESIQQNLTRLPDVEDDLLEDLKLLKKLKAMKSAGLI